MIETKPWLSDLYAMYRNDVLGMAIRAYKNAGDDHLEFLETALGLARSLPNLTETEAKSILIQARLSLLRGVNPSYPQPRDAGQFYAMMCSEEYPEDIRLMIASEVFGATDLIAFTNHIRENIPDIENS